jgi:hypothetical protein
MSSQVESETYPVKCECGQTGSVEWVQNDGYAVPGFARVSMG